MNWLEQMQLSIHGWGLSSMMVIGLLTLFSFFLGRQMKYIRLPQLIGYMIFGALLGPSFLGILDVNMQDSLEFITDISLGFVALSIGLELKLVSLKKLGSSIVYIIFMESIGAFLVTFLGLYLLTRNLPLSLIFGAIAPASAPAGTVAVIQEYRTKGPMTKALYAVVGFDDGLGIIIFGFAAAIARNVLAHHTGASDAGTLMMIWTPFKEILFSLILGCLSGYVFSFLAHRLRSNRDLLIVMFGIVLFLTGVSKSLHLSLILTNMSAGIIIVNTQPSSLLSKLNTVMGDVMPLLFTLFFTLAGAGLEVKALPALGFIGSVYMICRSVGLIGGSYIGGSMGKTLPVIKKYLGYGILSQAGVAIGLSLSVKHDFQGLGSVLRTIDGVPFTEGDHISAAVLATITATSIIFGIIGPILTKYSLVKAGEIKSNGT